jgi:hypothetical protein
MEKFVEDYCKKNNWDMYNLSDDEMNRICSAWMITSMGIEFKTMEEWQKE